MTRTASTPEEIEIAFAAIAKLPADIREQASRAAGVNPGMFKALEQALETGDPMAAVRYMRAHGGTGPQSPWLAMLEGLTSPEHLRMPRRVEVPPEPGAADTDDEDVWDPQAEEAEEEARKARAQAMAGIASPKQRAAREAWHMAQPLPEDVPPGAYGAPAPPQYGLPPANPDTLEQALQRADDFLDSTHIARIRPSDTPPNKIPGPRGEPSTAQHGEFSGGPGMRRDHPSFR